MMAGVAIGFPLILLAVAWLIIFIYLKIQSRLQPFR